MVIKASAAAEIRALVDALIRPAGPSLDVQREAAIARLAIIGGRAVDRLIDTYAKTTDRWAHIAILRALEATGDQRSQNTATNALKEGTEVGVAATGVLRALLSSPHDGVAASALDALIATALDRTLDRRLRLAALDALQDTPGDVRDRVIEAIRSDPDGGLREIARSIDGEAARADAVWSDATEGRLQVDPQALRRALGMRAATAPLNTLSRLIEAVRAKEADDAEWLALRGALHQALALRGSRVALYDLRETLERTASPLPVSFLTALHVLGDESCLEPLAAAWNSARPADARWKQQLSAAFDAIVRRERITRRHAVMKRIAARSPGLLRRKPDVTSTG